MEYKLLESKYTINYTNRYLLALQNGVEEECFVGDKEKYRMTARDSQLTKLSDPAVLLENCIYPLYTAGDIEIGKRVRNILKQLIESNDVIKIFQAINFIDTQDGYIEDYDKLPVVIDVTGLIPLALSAVQKKKVEMQSYKQGEFASYGVSIYDMACNMLEDLE